MIGNGYPDWLIFVMLFGYQAADNVTCPDVSGRLKKL
jgi:hypothetical protein